MNDADEDIGRDSGGRQLSSELTMAAAMLVFFGLIGAVLLLDVLMIGVFGTLFVLLAWASLRMRFAKGAEAGAARVQLARWYLREGLLGFAVMSGIFLLGALFKGTWAGVGVFGALTVALWGLSRWARVPCKTEVDT